MSELTDAEIDELSLFAVFLALRRLRNHCHINDELYELEEGDSK